MVETNHRFAYPEWLRTRLAREINLVPLSQLIKEYESETGRKLSAKAYQKGFKKVAGINIRRREQLYWWPNGAISEMKRTTNEPRSNGGATNEPAPPIHSSHRYRFSILYKGVQPMDGKVRAWGRKKNQYQVEYEMGKDMKLQVFKNRIMVMFHNPKGITPNEQAIEARSLCYLSIRGFAKDHNLILDGDFEKKLNPHFVLENDYMNKEIQKALKDYAEDIEQQTGTLIDGDDSHKHKVEHQGIDGNPQKLTGKQIAERFEWLVKTFPDQFATVARDQAHLSENHRSHVKAVQELAAGVKRQTEIFEAQLELFKQIKDKLR